jgi:hypothetical protein
LDGATALALLRRDLPIDVMIVPVALPGFDGAQLAARATAVRPALRIAFSGDADARPCVPTGLPRGEKLIGKPWRSIEFMRDIGRLVGTQRC